MFLNRLSVLLVSLNKYRKITIAAINVALHAFVAKGRPEITIMLLLIKTRPFCNPVY